MDTQEQFRVGSWSNVHYLLWENQNVTPLIYLYRTGMTTMIDALNQ
jgi:hypothetical protein